MKTEKIFMVHYKDEKGLTGNYKPIRAANKELAKKVFFSHEKLKNCKILSIN